MDYRRVGCAAGTVRYVDLGAGPAVLFLHGAGVQASSYAPLLEALAREHRVVAPDLPGFGGSFTPPAAWTAEDYAACLLDFASHVGLEAFDAVGQSFGASAAVALGVATPRVGRLVLIDPLAVPPPWGRGAMLFRFFVLKNLPSLVRPSRWPTGLRLLSHFVAGALRRLPFLWRMHRVVLRETFRGSRPLEAIRQPVTLLWGDRDEIFPPATAEAIVRRMPCAHTVLVPGGHDWCLFRGAEAAALVSEALRPGPTTLPRDSQAPA